MAKLQKKSMEKPDESRAFPKGKVGMITMEGVTYGLATFEPGWKWSESVKPIAKTESCQMLHSGYQISGKMHVRLDDGTELEFGPGDIFVIPPGHDGWVVGDESSITLDVTGGMADYAKKA